MTDIEAIKRELSTLSIENNELRKTVEKLKSKSTRVLDEKPKIEKQLSASESDTTTPHFKVNGDMVLQSKANSTRIGDQASEKEGEYEKQKSFDPNIITTIEIKTDYIYGTRDKYVSSSNASAVFAKHLSKIFGPSDFQWCIKYSLDKSNGSEERIRYLLTAHEYGKRHRRECDSEILGTPIFFDDDSIIQYAMVHYLNESTLRESILGCFLKWLLVTRYSVIQSFIIQFIEKSPSEDTIEPLLEIVYRMDESSHYALDCLSKYHDERIYKAACECLYSQSNYIIASASRVISGYGEHCDESFEILSDIEYSARERGALDDILKAMWDLDKNKAIELYLQRYQDYISQTSGTYLDIFRRRFEMLDVSLVRLDLKIKLKQMVHEIMNSNVLENHYKQAWAQILDKIKV